MSGKRWNPNKINGEGFPLYVHVGDKDGPAMRSLRNENQRQFAFLMGCGWNQTAAAKAAGYSQKASGAKVRASELMRHEDILAAIEEVGTKVFRTLGPRAVEAARNILEQPEHPAHGRIVETILDRTGYIARSEHKITVEHVDGKLDELVVRLAIARGIDPVKLVGRNSEVIEGEVVDADASSADVA